MTKIDILSGLSKIKVCIGYKLNGKKIGFSQCGYLELEKLIPVYKSLPGWKEDVSKIRSFKKLPVNCQKYIRFVENYLKVKIKIVSVSPDREASIFV